MAARANRLKSPLAAWAGLGLKSVSTFISSRLASVCAAPMLILLAAGQGLAQAPSPAKDAAQAPAAKPSPVGKTDAEPSRSIAGPDLNDVLDGKPGPAANADFEKRVEMIPMRDGVKLYTVIMIPKGAHDAPMLLTRTPYDAAKRVERQDSPTLLSALPQGDEVFVKDGYIRVFQDIRGKYGSEGTYVMTRPPRGPLNPTDTDDTTDAYDTVDWLVKNVPQSNGRVGMLGSSYEGWTVVMALLGPHPALRAAAPESPMVDGWMGDDWFHYGAFRQNNLDYITAQTSERGEGSSVPRAMSDDYSEFLQAGSLHEFAVSHGVEAYPFWRREEAHPPTTASGPARRSTPRWSPTRRACRPCGSRGYGTRRTCGARSIAGPPSPRPAMATPTIWSWARGGTAGPTTTAPPSGRCTSTATLRCSGGATC